MYTKTMAMLGMMILSNNLAMQSYSIGHIVESPGEPYKKGDVIKLGDLVVVLCIPTYKVGRVDEILQSPYAITTYTITTLINELNKSRGGSCYYLQNIYKLPKK